MRLHRFTGLIPCPKCGQPSEDARLCRFSGYHDPGLRVVEGDHLHRECGRCNYEWVELARDTPLMAESTRNRHIRAALDLSPQREPVTPSATQRRQARRSYNDGPTFGNWKALSSREQ